MNAPIEKLEPKDPFTFKVLDPIQHFDLSRNIADVSLIFFDLEGTGGVLSENGLTEVCCIKVLNGEVQDTFQSLVNPERPIPLFIQKMTNITPEMVKHSPREEIILPKLLDFIQDSILISHSAHGDFLFLRHLAWKRCRVKFNNFFICTHYLSNKLAPLAPVKTLGGLASYFGHTPTITHRAEADAILTLNVFSKLAEKLKTLEINTLEQVLRYQGDLDTLIRLGWKVPEDTIEIIPPKTGTLRFLGDKHQPIMLWAALNGQKELTKFFEPKLMAKKVLKKIYQTESIQFTTHRDWLSAHLEEVNSGIGGDSPLCAQPLMLYYEPLQDSADIHAWKIGTPSNKTIHAYGPIHTPENIKPIFEFFKEEYLTSRR